MRIKEILRRLEAVAEVLASLGIFGERIIQRLDEHYAAAGGEPAFSYQAVFEHLRFDLESIRGRLAAARDQHVRMRVKLAGLRRRIRQLATDLYDRQVAARRILGGAFDPDRSFEVAAVSGKTPRVDSVLEEQVGQTVNLLRQPEVDLGTVQADGVAIDLGEMAGGLESRLERLRQKRTERQRTLKAFGGTKVVKDQAIGYCDGLLPWVARTLESYCRIAGERELAERIRTSVRRAIQKPDGEEDSGEASADGSETAESAASASETAEVTSTPATI